MDRDDATDTLPALSMKTMWTLLLPVFVGGALGGMARYCLSDWVSRRWGERFPVGTLFVNVSGAAAIGFITVLSIETGSVVSILLYSFLGGYTTVSSFSLQTFALWQSGRRRAALLNASASWALCLAAVALGGTIGRLCHGPL